VQTAITGTKTKAGMFYDATATELIITTTTGTGAGVFPKFVRVVPSTLAVSSTVYSAAAGTSFSGTTDTFRGGARLADPLNASAATYWVATTSAVYAYTFSGTTATQTANRDFGQAVTVSDGLTHDGTVFRGFDAGSLTKVWKFSPWDFTTASTTLWVSYSWYDSNATGGTHETAVSPRASIVIRRREQMTVVNPAVPVGGTDDPDNRRIYFLQSATDTGVGTYWLQATGNFTSRTYNDYTGSGTHDGTGTAFPAGTPSDMKDAGGNWHLKGDGTSTFKDLVASGNATITGDIGLNGTAGSHGSNSTFTISGGGTATFGSKICEWVQIGKMVVFRLSFSVTANGSGATSVTIGSTGLPGTPTTNAIDGDRGGTGVVPLSWRGSGTPMGFSRILEMGGGTTVTGANLVSGAGYTAVGAYISV
jgi:hypothetical protein